MLTYFKHPDPIVGECAFIVAVGTGVKLFALTIWMILPQLERSYPNYDGVMQVFLASGGFLISGVVLFAIFHVVSELVNKFLNMARSLERIEEKL